MWCLFIVVVGFKIDFDVVFEEVLYRCGYEVFFDGYVCDGIVCDVVFKVFDFFFVVVCYYGVMC